MAISPPQLNHECRENEINISYLTALNRKANQRYKKKANFTKQIHNSIYLLDSISKRYIPEHNYTCTLYIQPIWFPNGYILTDWKLRKNWMGGCDQLFLTKGFERSLGILQSQIKKNQKSTSKCLTNTQFFRESPWVLTTVNHKRNLSSPRERERKGDGRVALLCKPGTRFNNTLRSKTSIIYTMSGPTMKKEREREKTTLFNVSTA